jgi:hypothetical protein
MKALRTVSETADIRVIEGLAIPFGGPYPGNSDDYGTRATAKTNFYWSLFPDRAPTDAPEVPARFTRPVTYGHGFDDAIGLVRIGGWSPIRQDKQGVWVQAQLDKRQAWYASIGELLDRDALSFSSASVEHAARIARNGDWVDWPVFELALTPTPSNPKAEVTVRSGKMRCAACDVSMATDVQGMLAQLMGTEEGEADQITLLKVAFDAVGKFIAAEAEEIGAEDVTDDLSFTYMSSHLAHRIGKRNNGDDQGSIDAMHDLTVKLGASAHAGDNPPDDESNQTPDPAPAEQPPLDRSAKPIRPETAAPPERFRIVGL